jgi:mRNA interferase MazF
MAGTGPAMTSGFDAFDIAVVPFPTTDRLAEKRRPALVISNRKLAPFGLIWVAMIINADNAPWSCDVNIADLARAGLPAPSVVRTAKIACIEPSRIERRAGKLDKATAKAVAQKLKGFVFWDDRIIDAVNSIDAEAVQLRLAIAPHLLDEIQTQYHDLKGKSAQLEEGVFQETHRHLSLCALANP